MAAASGKKAHDDSLDYLRALLRRGAGLFARAAGLLARFLAGLFAFEAGFAGLFLAAGFLGDAAFFAGDLCGDR